MSAERPALAAVPFPGSQKADRSDWRGWTGHGPNPKHSEARRRSWDTRRERYGAHGGNRRRRSFHVKHANSDGGSKG